MIQMAPPPAPQAPLHHRLMVILVVMATVVVTVVKVKAKLQPRPQDDRIVWKV